MALVWYDRVKMTTATTGTGTITLGSAVSGYRSFTGASVPDGSTCYYAIEDGTSWEVGLGTYTAAGTTLARTTLLASSTGSKITLSGNAVVWIDVPAAWFTDRAKFQPSATQTVVNGSTSGTATYSMPFQGSSYKKVIVHLDALVGTAGYTFPVAFTNTPVVVTTSGLAAAIITTGPSTTAMEVTGTTTTGVLIVEGY